MKNQKTILSIRGIAISMIITLLATGSNVFAGRGGKKKGKKKQITFQTQPARPITTHHLDELKGIVSNHNVNYGGGIVKNPKYIELHKLLIENQTSTFNDSGHRVLSYFILNGNINQDDCIYCLDNQFLNNYLKKLIGRLENETLEDNEIQSAIIKSGSYGAIKALAIKIEKGWVKTSPDIIFQIARILNKKTLFKLTATKTENISELKQSNYQYGKNIDQALQFFLEKCKNIPKKKLDQYTKKVLNQNNQSLLEENFSALLWSTKNKQHDQLRDNIITYLIQKNRSKSILFKALFSSACQKTNCEEIFYWLEKIITCIMKLPDNDKKLRAFTILQSILSNRYSMDDPDDANKLRTSIHCILRNADGSCKKMSELASRENTVRALLMLIVAGANPFCEKDEYTNKPGNITQGCFAGNIPHKSLKYLNNGVYPCSTNGASFRFLRNNDIFGRMMNNLWVPNQNITDDQRDNLRNNLRRMCHLCQFVMGTTEENLTTQRGFIKSAVLPNGAPMLPCDSDNIKAYLEQILDALKAIRQCNITTFISNFQSPYDHAEDIKNNVNDYLRSTTEVIR